MTYSLTLIKLMNLVDRRPKLESKRLKVVTFLDAVAKFPGSLVGGSSLAIVDDVEITCL